MLEEGFSQDNTDVVGEVLNCDFVCYDPNSESGEVRRSETIKAEIGYFRNAVPDLTYNIEDQIAEGDKEGGNPLYGKWHSQGEFFGVAGTGERITMSGMSIDRFEGGKMMVEEWPEYSCIGVVRKLASVSPRGVSGRRTDR